MPTRAGGDLPLGDLGALVRLGVRAEADLGLLAVGGHFFDVGLEGVEIDDEGGRGNVGLGEAAHVELRGEGSRSGNRAGRGDHAGAHGSG